MGNKILAGVTGYVYAFESYEGASTESQEFSEEFGSTGSAVLRLCKLIKDKNHEVFFNNLFTTIPLLLKLVEWKNFSTGTIRTNRLQEAKNKLKPIEILEKEQRVAFSIITSEENLK